MYKVKNSFAERISRATTNARIAELEKKVNKPTSKSVTTLNQQLLLLEELGILKEFKNLGLTDTKLGELLGVILNGNKDNIRKVLSTINSKDAKIKNPTNYEFLSKTFENAGLNDHAKKADLEFSKASDKKKK